MPKFIEDTEEVVLMVERRTELATMIKSLRAMPGIYKEIDELMIEKNALTLLINSGRNKYDGEKKEKWHNTKKPRLPPIPRPSPREPVVTHTPYWRDEPHDILIEDSYLNK